MDGVIIERKAYVAWCRRCDEQASPAQRDTTQKARDDLRAHVNIVHADAK